MSDPDSDNDNDNKSPPHVRPVPEKKKRQGGKIALALGSGSARGWAHIGVIRAMHDAGIIPDIICGSSIGALVGASYVNGRLADLEKWAIALTRWKMVRFVDVSFSSGAVLDGVRLREELSDVIADCDALIEDLPIRYAAVATKLLSGQEVKFTRGSLHDAVWSSAAIPGILPPMYIGEEWLVDGGLVNPVPVNLCRYLDADIVIAVNLNGNIIGRKLVSEEKALQISSAIVADASKEASLSKLKESITRHPLYPFSGDWSGNTQAGPKSPGLIETFADAINIMQDRITRSRMVGDPPDVLITPQLDDMGMMDFSRAEEAINTGYSSVERQLPEIRHRLKFDD